VVMTVSQRGHLTVCRRRVNFLKLRRRKRKMLHFVITLQNLLFPNYKQMSSSQALVRLGENRDLYYTDDKNCLKQSIPVTVDTRFRQDFSNKSTGVSVFTIPPVNGLRHVLIVIGYRASSINGQLGARALERGWGYKAISQVSFRVGGSSQYFLTGDQLLARNLRLVRTQSQADALLSLGGNECKVAADFDVDQYAYIPVSIWAAPSEDELGVPLPSDILQQQVQITAELAPTSAFWSAPIAPNEGAPDVLPPTSFDTAYFQIEQLQMKDRGMALSSRVDMATHMYSMPLPTFDQQEFVIPIAAGGAVTPVVLSGFRAGEVKKIQIWMEKVGDEVNALRWYTPKNVQLLYAGQVYANFEEGSSAIWNLLDGTKPSAVNQSALAITGVAPNKVWSSTPVLSSYVELPLAQPSGSDYEADLLVHGMEITNGIANLTITPPDASAYNLHVVYVYNCTLGFSRGSCELIF
jgi:hypothetical protein